MPSDPPGVLRVGIVGAGMAASAPPGILPGMVHLRDRAVIAGITSRTRERAEAVAEEFGIATVYSTLEEMLDDDSIDAVVNLTPIDQHAPISAAVLTAGRHLVTEKPLSSSLLEADQLIALAARRDRFIVCAPARMLDPSRILAKRLVESGAIGPVSFARVRSSHAGPAWQSWPTHPAWYYGRDAGPLLDLGVYGLQEITGILGPARSVTCSSSRLASTRVVRGGPFDGEVIDVDSDDNTMVTLAFAGGEFALVDCTFAVRAASSPALEIFGLGGTINLNDGPATSPVEVYRVDSAGIAGSWTDEDPQPLVRERTRFKRLGRAVLVEHLADCIDGRRPILTPQHARHVLEIMFAAKRSAREGRRVDLETTF